MIVKTITEAKAELASLIDAATRGEEVLIGEAGAPVAKLVPIELARKPRFPGALKGKIVIADDFDELPDDIAEAFGMR